MPAEAVHGVDDELLVREAVAGRLTSEGYSVLVAGSADDALSKSSLMARPPRQAPRWAGPTMRRVAPQRDYDNAHYNRCRPAIRLVRRERRMFHLAAPIIFETRCATLVPTP